MGMCGWTIPVQSPLCPHVVAVIVDDMYIFIYIFAYRGRGGGSGLDGAPAAGVASPSLHTKTIFRFSITDISYKLPVTDTKENYFLLTLFWGCILTLT